MSFQAKNIKIVTKKKKKNLVKQMKMLLDYDLQFITLSFVADNGIEAFHDPTTHLLPQPIRNFPSFFPFFFIQRSVSSERLLQLLALQSFIQQVLLYKTLKQLYLHSSFHFQKFKTPLVSILCKNSFQNFRKHLTSVS